MPTLEGEQDAPTRTTETPATRQAKPEDASELLADLIARVEALERIAALRAVPPPAPAPEPRPQTKGKLPDRRRSRDGGLIAAPGRWLTGGLVRCADCLFGHDIDGSGYCRQADREIRWAFARRSCSAFAAFEELEA